MKIDVFAESGANQKILGEEFRAWLSGHGAPPDFVAIHENLDCHEGLNANGLPDTTIVHGATSCLGVMSHKGPRIDNGAGAFAIWDPDGDYGTAMRPILGDGFSAARLATISALAVADRQGEAPDLVWVSASPGQEEIILAGIEDVIGTNVPIMGGSAADNDVSGKWFVFDKTGRCDQGVVVSVLFPSRPVSFAYHNGDSPTEQSGIVTASDGRLLREIDGRPAADVYREWTNGAIPESVDHLTPILSESTLSPLGLFLDSVGSVPFYLLAHPASLTPSRHLQMFANIKEGDTVTLMQGSPAGLTERAGKVACLAAQSDTIGPDAVAGGLIVYCGGCMLAVKDRLKEVTDGVNAALDGAPFLGTFTFGEQGRVLGQRNRHGNLMISAVLFGT